MKKMMERQVRKREEARRGEDGVLVTITGFQAIDSSDVSEGARGLAAFRLKAAPGGGGVRRCILINFQAP